MTGTARDTLILLCGTVLAVLVGIGIAYGDWLWPALGIGAAVIFAVHRLSPLPWMPTALWVLLMGYMVGNRGFAQLSVSSSLPLFPAELVLALLGCAFIWRAARRGHWGLPFNTGTTLILLWLAYGTARLAPDVRIHGFTALRDYATVYYAAFYFLGYLAAEDEAPQKWFDAALRWGSALLLPLYGLFSAFPEFFIETLTFRGVPILYYKGDLVGTYLALGAIAWYFRFGRPTGHWVHLAASLACVGGVVLTHNRASLLALAVAAAFLAVTGRRGFVKTLVFGGAAAALAITLWVQAGFGKWADTPVPAVTEALASLTDFEGTGAYATEASGPKGDNNRFRAVWWRTVIQETNDENALVGLGFGHDLASRFLQVYYPDSTDDFTARSPHSILVTLFARMGLVGLVLFLAIVALLVRDTWKALTRSPNGEQGVAGCTAIIVLVSACFGVVLEGPMGAVFFWVGLGIAHKEAHTSEDAPKTNPSLDTQPSNV